jgi:D-glycero-alpha-D-manno-heptose-7-phosphate kinase
VIVRAPLRVSLFGGGSDYPAYFRKHGGAVLGFAIKKYVYVSIRLLPPFFPHKHRIVWSQIEMVQKIDEIKHPAIRAILQEWWGDERPGLEIHYDGDLPSMSGMGSSSAFVVAMIKALSILRGVSSPAIAEEAIRIEQDVIGENVGCQDQMWATYGGFNRMDFYADESRVVHNLPLERADYLLSHMMLCFTGMSRIASEVAADQIARIDINEKRIERMVRQVDQAERLISTDEDLSFIGAMLHESWQIKRTLSPAVSNGEIDFMYKTAIESGAIGGKLLGAGAGGFLLLFAHPHHHTDIREALPGRIWVDLSIDYEGAKVVVNGHI